MSQQILWALVAQTAVIVAGVFAVIMYNNARFNAIDRRFEDLIRYVDARFKAIEDRLDRLERHPVTRP